MALQITSHLVDYSDNLKIDSELEWKKEYNRLGRIFASWGGLFALSATPFSMIAESKVIPDDHQLWVIIRVIPFALIGISLLLFRIYKFSHEWMFEIIGLSLFFCLSYRVNCTAWDTNMITGMTVLIPAAFMSLTRPRFLILNFSAWLVFNISLYCHFCNKSFTEYFSEKGSVTLIITAIASVLLAILRYYNIKNNFINRIVLKEAMHELEIQKKQSDTLLLNILPEEAAAELKEKGKVTPRYYEMVTVLFTDFKGFTILSEKRSPAETLDILEKCFSAFDVIIDKYNLEKIKTIGDGYLCAGGVPVPNTSNAKDAIKAAIEMQEFMKSFNEEPGNENKLEVRIGIHTGPVVAGVIGNRKFAYDIWGDTVNTASRMESSGIEGRVNISESTYQAIKDDFDCEYRGMVKAKNKDDMKMYLVTGRKSTPPVSPQNAQLEAS